MVQLGLDGMPTRLYACTPTRLSTWLDCPRRYRMTYLDRPPLPKGPPWAHNSVGASIHNALAGWWGLSEPERTVTRAGALVASGWLGDGFRDDAQSASWRERARGMVQRYVEPLDPGDEPVGVERTVAVKTAGLAFSGRVDRIDRRGDDVVVVDYKTGRRPPTTQDVRGSLALALYALATERVLRRRCRRVELHHLPTDTVVAHDLTDDALQRHLRRATSIAGEAAAAVAAHRAGAPVDVTFPARPSALCGWCDWSRHCPEGRAAAAPRNAWDGLGAA